MFRIEKLATQTNCWKYIISEHLINNLNYHRPWLNGLFLYFVEFLIISIILNHFLIINKISEDKNYATVLLIVQVSGNSSHEKIQNY